MTFANASVWVASATFSKPGDYVLRLVVNDGASTVNDTLGVRVLGPIAPPPELRSITLAGLSEPVIRLQFTTEAGFRYTVQYRDALSEGSWQTLYALPVQGESGLLTVSDPLALERPARYYRIVQE